MRVFTWLLFAFFSSVFFSPLQALADPGDLDTTFGGGDGIATINLGASDLGTHVRIQPDGKILVSGSHTPIGPGINTGVVRFNADGSLDTPFGGGDGVAGVDFPAAGGIDISFALLDNGQFFAAHADPNGYALIRFNSDGLVDGSFGTGGKVFIAEPTGDVVGVRDIAVQPDGKIVMSALLLVGGNFQVGLARANTDGSPDGTFGGPSGTIVDPSIFNRGLEIQPDGKILLCAETVDHNFTLLRFNSDGLRDGGFGTNGAFNLDFGKAEICYDLALQPDGKVVMGGVTGDTDMNGQFTSGEVALARVNSDGTLDGSFGSGGKITHNLGVLTSAQSLALQANGKIVSSGTLSTDADTLSDNFMVARYNADGSLDTTFGSNGFTATPVAKNSSGNALALDSSGDLVVMGYFDNDELDNAEDDFAVVRYLGGEVSSGGGGGGGGGGGCQMSPIPPNLLPGFLLSASLFVLGLTRFRRREK